MYPTVPASDVVLLVSRLHRFGRGVKVGDFVEAESLVFTGQGVGKRVLGMGGDWVVKSAGAQGGEEDGAMTEPEMIQVPDGHVWLEGDNLAWSRDSRFYGPVPMALIKGKVVGWGDGLFTWRWGEPLREVPDV